MNYQVWKKSLEELGVGSLDLKKYWATLDG